MKMKNKAKVEILRSAGFQLIGMGNIKVRSEDFTKMLNILDDVRPKKKIHDMFDELSKKAGSEC